MAEMDVQGMGAGGGRYLPQWGPAPAKVQNTKANISISGCIYMHPAHGNSNKSSAVAKVGDRLATIDMGRKVLGAVPLFRGGAESPSNTMSPVLRSIPPYYMAS